MLFSQRKKLEEEYYQWLEKTGKEHGVKVEDCPFNMIVFLEIKGLLKNEIKVIDNEIYFPRKAQIKLILMADCNNYGKVLADCRRFINERIYYNNHIIAQIKDIFSLDYKIYCHIVFIRDIGIPDKPCIFYDGDRFHIEKSYIYLLDEESNKNDAILDKSNRKV